jgi:hypothetical protein
VIEWDAVVVDHHKGDEIANKIFNAVRDYCNSLGYIYISHGLALAQDGGEDFRQVTKESGEVRFHIQGLVVERRYIFIIDSSSYLT